MASRIITVRSYRRGTGKSTITANAAVQLVMDGFRVGIAEVGFDLPGIKFAFGYNNESTLRPSLNDFLDNSIVMEDLFFHVGSNIDPDVPEQAYLADQPLWLATAKPANHVPRSGEPPQNFDFSLLYRTLTTMSAALNLDYLFLDAASAFYADDMALYSMVMSDLVLVVMQPDQQDYQGTAVLISLIRQMGGIEPCLVMNGLPERFDPLDVENRLRDTYQVASAAALPLAEDLLTFDRSHLLLLRDPDHNWSQKLRTLARRLPDLLRDPVSTDMPSLSRTLREQITGREPGLVKQVKRES